MYGWTASVHWLVGRQGTARAHVGLGWRRCPDGGIDVSRPGGLLMNKEEIWFTTRHVAGSGGVAAQASGFQRMPGRELRRIAKRAPLPLRLMPCAFNPQGKCRWRYDFKPWRSVESVDD